MHALFVFSSIEPYPPVAIAILFYLEFVQWNIPHFSYCWMPSPLQAHWERWRHICLLQLACLFTVHVGECSSPLWWRFPYNNHCYKLSPLQGWWMEPPLLLSPACLFTVCVRECPSPTLPSSRHPASLLCVFFFFQLFVYYSLDGGQSVQGAMLICPREYRVLLICSPGGLPSRVEAGI
jgi:hypothetical protein